MIPKKPSYGRYALQHYACTSLSKVLSIANLPKQVQIMASLQSLEGFHMMLGGPGRDTLAN